MPAYPGTEENSWWTAVGCTLLAIASVSSETAQGILPDDFTSHVLGCGILALTFFCAFIALKSTFSSRKAKLTPNDEGVSTSRSPRSPPGHRVQSWAKRKEVTIMKGVVQKYSEKKEWGTISVHDSDSESDVELRVRFLRSERDRIDLKGGEHVIFRAVKDQQLEGWLLAETIWKAPERSEATQRLRPQAANKAMD
ncbi:unnamed protein product [Cladocopium goreaui]|uniref:SH3 domain-containing protein n=1 Tax=Cladocopium goreaui TaxID=2562237 RepID=A0A9P1FS70_9DINO|nr:unnamed protein product [Cladocopium goreaui]